MSVLRLVSTAWQTARYNHDWPRYIWARLAPPGDDALLSFRLRTGQIITLRGSTRETLNEIYLHRVYDIPGMDISTFRHVLDFGANMGVFALYVAAHAPDAVIACFEPSSENFRFLERNLVANGLRARAYRMAVSSTCEPRRLSLSGDAGEYTLTRQSDIFEIVDCADLGKVFEITGFKVCDFLKMDVEGEELAILHSAPIHVLRRIRAMAMEWHDSPEHLDIIQAYLRDAGFQTMTEVVGHAHMQIMLKAWQL
jgi:FkbM family methyltransferase